MSIVVADSIAPAVPADAEAILTLQKLAYRSEAERYGDFTIPPLTQTLAGVIEDFNSHLFLKVCTGGRLVGSVKGRLDGRTCYVGRLMVHPDLQGKGLGTRLMQGVETFFPAADRFELFTGHRSEGNIRLYQRLGYRIFRTEPVNTALTLVFMEKPARQNGCASGE